MSKCVVFILIWIASIELVRSGTVQVAVQRNQRNKLRVQEILRKNSILKNAQPQKKLQQGVNNLNLTRADRIKAMGPNGLTLMKKNTQNKIQQFQEKLNISRELTQKEKDYKIHLLNMFIEELTESEKDMMDAQEALRKSLLTDFRDHVVLMDNSRKRLDALRIATMKEEQSFNKMKSIEEAMKQYEEHGNSSLSLMDEFLQEIADAADQLELDIEEKILPENNPVVDGSRIEAVLHLKEGEDHLQADSNSSLSLAVDVDERLDVLIDSQNNKFILTRPKDTTSPVIDHYLILNIIIIYVTSFPLSILSKFIGVPSIFGYIMSGLILGPSGLNAIEALVQVESFGEFGVFMIMFFAGLEFSLEKVQKVWKIAVQAPTFISLAMIVCSLLIGSLLNYDIPKGESAFIGACMSMSSTPLVLKFLQGSTGHDSGDYSSLLMAMLVMQDVQLGVIVASLPAFAPSPNSDMSNAILHTTVTILSTIGSLVFMFCMSSFLLKYCIPNYFTFLGNQPRELYLLGGLTFMFLLQLMTNSIYISMELGCFLAGLLVSVSGHQSKVERALSPLHDFFYILFFATVGFHIFPKFVAVEITYLVWLTTMVIAGKYLISLVILDVVLRQKHRHVKWVVAGGLAQVSEFAFVLASRARHLKIVSREVFLLILSVTTLSLVFAPVMWKISLWKLKNSIRDK